MEKPRQTELLSPAGSWDALVAAVQSGADAVYLGGTAFSARAGADNFDDMKIVEAVRYCHIRGVKVFVTLNTLLKQNELAQALTFASFLEQAGVDALIIQDLGLAAALLKSNSGIALHASTQMTVHSVAGAQKLAQLGFKRVVLARELSVEQIKQIKHAVDIELEVFVHGAICQCYSGQCLLSSFLGGRSGNRGRCAQPCRLPYELKDRTNKTIRKGYLLSPKDLCLLPHLGAIKRAGIDSLKIEGRLKRPEYVAAVTGIYRKYLDSADKPSEQDMQALLDAFNRSGFTDGYFTGKLGRQMMSYSSPSNVSPEKFDPEVKKRFAQNANYRLVDVWATCEIRLGKQMSMTLSDCDGNSVTAYGETVQAGERSLDYARAYTQLSKFGSVPFCLKELKLTFDMGAAVSVSALNALRRLACEKLIEQRCSRQVKMDGAASIGFIGKAGDMREMLSVEVQSLKQAHAVLELSPDRLYVPLDVADKLLPFTGKTEIVTVLPAIVDNDKEKIFDRISTAGVLCSSIGVAGCLCGKHTVYGDWRLNLFNTAAVYFCGEAGFESVTLSPELNLREIGALGKEVAGACEVVAYGHMPLMVMKNCVIKACSGNCGKQKGIYWLTDRKKQAFAVLCEPVSCTNLLLNARPLYMADRLGELKQHGVKKIRLIFTIEDAHDCARITQEYQRAMRGEAVYNRFGENAFTRGHFYRGVK